MKSSAFADGSIQGTNDFKVIGGYNAIGYDGPAASGHRYKFTLYALDAAINLPANFSPAEFKAALPRHVLEKTELVGVSP